MISQYNVDKVEALEPPIVQILKFLRQADPLLSEVPEEVVDRLAMDPEILAATSALLSMLREKMQMEGLQAEATRDDLEIAQRIPKSEEIPAVAAEKTPDTEAETPSAAPPASEADAPAEEAAPPENPAEGNPESPSEPAVVEEAPPVLESAPAVVEQAEASPVPESAAVSPVPEAAAVSPVPEPTIAPPVPEAAPPPPTPPADAWTRTNPWSRPHQQSAPLHPTQKPGSFPVSQRSPVQPAPSVSPAPAHVQLRLPNGRAGEPYREKLTVQGVPSIFIDRWILPDGFRAEGDLLIGTPATAGDYRLKIRFSLVRSGRPYEAEVALLVNPDPRSLWQDLASDRQAPYWKPDTATRQEEWMGRRIAAASRRGRSHAHVGSFRDDDFEILADPESGWLVVAVADGAGSAPYSREGSRLAVQQACRAVLEGFAGETGKKVLAAAGSNRMPDGVYQVLGKAAQEAVRVIEAAAAHHPSKPRDFSTTLLFAALHALPEGGYAVASFWCGDGAMALYNAPTVQLLGEAESGEYAGQTRFLDRQIFSSGTELYRRLRFVTVPQFTALLLMTDGVSDPHFETEQHLNMPTKWRDFWAQLQLQLNSGSADLALLDWLNFWSPGNHDDRTLLVVW